MIIQRRSFLTSIAAALAAPAIVRAENLMPIRGIIMDSGAWRWHGPYLSYNISAPIDTTGGFLLLDPEWKVSFVGFVDRWSSPYEQRV